MKWDELIQIIRCRALEETDREGRAWSADTANHATREASAKAGKNSAKFLKLRSEALLNRAKGTELIIAPAVPGWLITAIWILAFVIGWMLAGIGQEREINLLALPLIFILVWNVTVIIISLLTSFGKGHENAVPSWLKAILDRLSGAKSVTPAGLRFQELFLPVMLKRLAPQARAWLHIGAALLALGSCTAMYARGWSREYRAVWESTLLSEQTAPVFFRIMFGPASTVSGVTIPLSEIPVMHQTLIAPASQPGSALPWINLYVLTLVLGVVLPRFLFAALETWRASRVADSHLQTSDWKSYISDLLSDAVPRGQERATLFIHASGADESTVSRWRNALLEHWREVGEVSLQRIASGDEDDFVNAWTPSTRLVAFAFSLATTPEEEVQGLLFKTTLSKQRLAYPNARILVLLDAATLDLKWKGVAELETRLQEKAAAWKRVLADETAEITVLRADRRLIAG